MVPSVCMYTACGLLVIALYIQYQTDYLTLFTGTLMLASTVGLVHHSRLHTWYVNDWIRWTDIMLWCTVAVLGWTDCGHQIRWLCAIGYAIIVLGLNRILGDEDDLPYWHASVHVVVGLTLLSLPTSRR